jgi:hypothetical protein
MSDEILVECDNLKHAPGKVSKVVRFYRDETVAAGAWLFDLGGKEEPTRRAVTRGKPRADGYELFRCNLCGDKLSAKGLQRVQLGPDSRAWKFEPEEQSLYRALDDLATRGASRTTLKELKVLASK